MRGHHKFLTQCHEPTIIKQRIRQVAKVVQTDRFRRWYDKYKCEAAPEFAEFWRYCRNSLRYDIPGRELASFIWEALDDVFRTYDDNLRPCDKTKSQAFLARWGSRFLDKLEHEFGYKPRIRCQSLDDARHETYEVDFVGYVELQAVKRWVDSLPPDDKAIVYGQYYESKSAAQIGIELRRRKDAILMRQRKLLDDLREVMSNV